MTRKKKNRRFKLTHLLTGIMAVYIVAVLWNQRGLMKELQSKKSENIIVNQELEKEIKDLEEQIENSQTLQFVEKVARDELGMVKPKEIIIIDKNKGESRFPRTIRK